jgi:hypothetical protein
LAEELSADGSHEPARRIEAVVVELNSLARTLAAASESPQGESQLAGASRRTAPPPPRPGQSFARSIFGADDLDFD